jgi:outer membrane murein-binding lipoprotein Lpp
VAGVWAVAATAIAAIALVVANRANDDKDDIARASGQVRLVRRDLDARIDALSDRIDQLPRSGDLAKLDNRLKTVESEAGRTTDRIDQLGGRVDELGAKVKDLERSSATGTDTTATTP